MIVRIEQQVPKEDWQELANNLSPRLSFQSGAWLSSWGHWFFPAHQQGAKNPRFLTFYSSTQKLQAVLPLYDRTILGRSFSALGGYYIPFRGPLVAQNAPEETLHSFVSALPQQLTGPLLALSQLERTTTNLTLLQLLREKGWRLARLQEEHNWEVTLPTQRASFWQRFRGKRLKKLRYYRNKLQTDFQRCRWSHVHNVSPECWSHTLRALAAIEHRSWKGSQGDYRFCGWEQQAFWQEFLSTPVGTQACHAWILFLDEKPTSFCFALDAGTTRHILANRYIPDVYAYSTGSLLYQDMFTNALDSPIAHVNLGYGDSGYKARWSAVQQTPVQSWLAFPPTWTGKTLFQLYETSRAWRTRLAQSIPSR